MLLYKSVKHKKYKYGAVPRKSTKSPDSDSSMPFILGLGFQVTAKQRTSLSSDTSAAGSSKDSKRTSHHLNYIFHSTSHLTITLVPVPVPFPSFPHHRIPIPIPIRGATNPRSAPNSASCCAMPSLTLFTKAAQAVEAPKKAATPATWGWQARGKWEGKSWETNKWRSQKYQ